MQIENKSDFNKAIQRIPNVFFKMLIWAKVNVNEDTNSNEIK